MIEVPYVAIPDDHVSVWYEPLPEAVQILVRELAPTIDLERVQVVAVIPHRRFFQRWSGLGANAVALAGDETFSIELQLLPPLA